MQELLIKGRQYFLETLEELLQGYAEQYKDCGFEQMITDAFSESGIRLYEDTSLDDLNTLFYEDINEKLQQGNVYSLNNLGIQICIEFLENTIDLAEAYELLNKYPNDVFFKKEVIMK